MKKEISPAAIGIVLAVVLVILLVVGFKVLGGGSSGSEKHPGDYTVMPSGGHRAAPPGASPGGSSQTGHGQ